MMEFRIYRFSCLASVAWAALMAPQAWAADEVFADAADVGIVVNGSPIRESLEASLEIQRESDKIVNAITDRKSVVSGTSVARRVVIGGRLAFKIHSN